MFIFVNKLMLRLYNFTYEHFFIHRILVTHINCTFVKVNLVDPKLEISQKSKLIDPKQDLVVKIFLLVLVIYINDFKFPKDYSRYPQSVIQWNIKIKGNILCQILIKNIFL